MRHRAEAYKHCKGYTIFLKCEQQGVINNLFCCRSHLTARRRIKLIALTFRSHAERSRSILRCTLDAARMTGLCLYKNITELSIILAADNNMKYTSWILLPLLALLSCAKPKYQICRQSELTVYIADELTANFIPVADEDLKTSRLLDTTCALLSENKLR